MKHLLLVFFISLLVGFGIARCFANNSELSEISKLKAENWKLKYTLTKSQCDTQLNQLNSERSSLEQLFRTELNVEPKAQFDWATYTFKMEKK